MLLVSCLPQVAGDIVYARFRDLSSVLVTLTRRNKSGWSCWNVSNCIILSICRWTLMVPWSDLCGKQVTFDPETSTFPDKALLNHARTPSCFLCFHSFVLPEPNFCTNLGSTFHSQINLSLSNRSLSHMARGAAHKHNSIQPMFLNSRSKSIQYGPTGKTNSTLFRRVYAKLGHHYLTMYL